MTIAHGLISSKLNVQNEVKKLNRLIAHEISAVDAKPMREYRDLLITAILYVEQRELRTMEE